MSFDFPELSTYQWSCADDTKRFTVHNPATGKPLTTIQAGDAHTVDQAVQASQTAFTNRWRPLAPRERSTYLLRCADELEKHADELATLLCLENGKPKQDARLFDINFLVGVFRFFGSLCDKLPSEFYDRGAMYCTVFYEPYGVCCGILPFNWPPIHTGGKLAPALAAGNTMVLKPGEQAPLTMIRIVEILQTVLPQDVVQFVPGLGAEVPQALVTHPLVKMVSFTGSTAAGAAVAKSASASITPVVLELGGKNAFIVFEDADFDLAVRDALDGAFFNKGEACTATSRLLIHESLYDNFVTKLAAAVKRIRAGNGLDPQTHVGPQVSQAQQQRVNDYIALGAHEGARIAAQAQLPSDPACHAGFFAPATLLADVNEHMRIFREEIFGPVVTATPFRDFADAIRLANSSDYGLTAAVYTRDTLQANRAVRALDSGMVWVNNYNRNMLGTPFGGRKHSGYGREHSIETLREWCCPKTVHHPSGLGEIPKWRGIRDIFGESGCDVLGEAKGE
ncbi:Aldehyde dehydrogenase mpl4 [Oleoguttula mirabilis]|uniref:aldehyde dehydrogenase (NAD(+)) n=1 Tax=Oleoguttula mirabilis TaxID=1507867 RepID=A0AAV9JKY6_9PEZI|nr:Aldehyde dehydrogenase mpl4 [Oleoguttula mirabilis]